MFSLQVGNLLHRTAMPFPACVKKGIGTLPATVTHTLLPITVIFPASDGFSERTATSTLNEVTLRQSDCVMVASEIWFPLARGVAPGRALAFNMSLMNAVGATDGGIPHVSIEGCRASLSVFEEVRANSSHIRQSTYGTYKTGSVYKTVSASEPASEPLHTCVKQLSLN